MARPRSEATARAVEFVLLGSSPVEAAKHFKINVRTIYRDPEYRAQRGLPPHDNNRRHK